MKVVAKTESGYLIQASESEIAEILSAVTGIRPKEIDIGQKIPAIDYATTITKIKALRQNYQFVQLLDRIERFYESTEELKVVVEKASEIEV